MTTAKPWNPVKAGKVDVLEFSKREPECVEVRIALDGDVTEGWTADLMGAALDSGLNPGDFDVKDRGLMIVIKPDSLEREVKRMKDLVFAATREHLAEAEQQHQQALKRAEAEEKQRQLNSGALEDMRRRAGKL